VAVAARNAEQLGLRPQASFREGDWHAPSWADALGTFDLILCNPPYVESTAVLAPQVAEFEPATALFAGPEGLDDYRVLLPQLRALMNPHAVAIFEIGAVQAQSVTALAAAAGFSTELRRDLAGRARAVLLR
jgi:release factor glutamine methyltransferase